MDELKIKRLEKEGRRFCVHDDGVWMPFIYVYTFNNRRYDLELWARSMEEADEVCKAVRATLLLGGEILN